MGFSIRFLSPEEYGAYDPEPDLILGEICIGSFTEQFEASTSYWSVPDYQKHWKEAIERIVHGERKSCLITSMYDPEQANFIFWWLMYREEEKVIFQNQILFLEDEGHAFKPEDLYSSIRDREQISDTGRPISEWEIKVQDLLCFIDL